MSTRWMLWTEWYPSRRLRVCVGILIPRAVTGGGAERGLGHEGGGLLNGICAFVPGTRRDPSPLPPNPPGP